MPRWRYIEVLGGDLDKWRMADRAASRGSQLAMSSNGFNTTTSPHSPSTPAPHVSYPTALRFAWVIVLGAKHLNSPSSQTNESYGPHI